MPISSDSQLPNCIIFIKPLIENVLQKIRYKFTEYDKKVAFVNYFVEKHCFLIAGKSD